MTEQEKAELDALKAENASLKTTKETLEAEVLANKESNAKLKVEAALAAKKIHPDQKEHALKMCKTDPEEFEKFIGAGKPFVTAPGSDLFDNKQQPAGNQLSDAELKAATGGTL